MNNMKKVYKYKKEDIFDALVFIFELNEDDINLAIYNILKNESLFKGLDITVETLSHKEDYDYEAQYDLWHQIVDQCDWDDNNWYDEEFTKEYDYDLTAEDVKQTIKKYDKSLSKDFIKELKDMWGDDILEEITDILKEDNLI
jgi:hypothetical protein